jgi:hypothetical protein
MKLNTNAKADVNYLSKIVQIDAFTQHINPEVTRLKVAHVDGYNILVGIDEQPGKFVYFPAMSCINPQLLAFANLYRHKELNEDPEKTGMFEDNGRVKAIRLKGQVSEGFLLPLNTLVDFVSTSTIIAFDESDCPVGTEFNEVEHKGKSFWISKKYMVKEANESASTGGNNVNRSQKKVKKFHRVIDTQFRFHYNVPRIQKIPDFIKPNDLIHISSKWDGTSVVFAHVLCKHPLTWKEKIAKFLTKREFNDYDYIYSTHHVIQNGDFIDKKLPTWYGEGGDVYRYAFEYIKPFIPKGMTIYAELVGFTPNNKCIMKRSLGIYDYGCVMREEGEPYTYDKHYKIRVYRITMTNVDGIVHEFSAREVQQWCRTVGLIPVVEYYYGYAKDLYPDIPVTAPDYGQQFIEHLSDEKRFYMELDSPDCVNKVPAEGIVIRKEDMVPFAVKLKSFYFLDQEQKDQDKGIVNLEDLA